MKALILLFLFAASIHSFAQDERYYRRIFSHEVHDNPTVKQTPKVIAISPNYRLDLNRDGSDEIIKTEKRDGIDYFMIKDHFGRTLLEKKLSTVGSESAIYRVQLKTISANTDALIIHFYEGAIQATNFVGTARLYLLTISNRDLKKLHFFQGPHFFSETEKFGDKYSVRRFSVNTLDYNNDGIKEISITYNNINRIFFYVAEGVWKKI